MMLVAVAVSGCGVEQQSLSSLREIIHTASTGGQETEQPAVADDEADKAFGQDQYDVPFDPPYPERVDPFTFPAGTTVAKDQPGTSITAAAQVDVLGFADVGEARVFLRTKETTHSLSVGDMIEGVEVIGIHPPTVDLRMGSLQWRASMFDNTNSP